MLREYQLLVFMPADVKRFNIPALHDIPRQMAADTPCGRLQPEDDPSTSEISPAALVRWWSWNRPTRFVGVLVEISPLVPSAETSPSGPYSPLAKSPS